MLGHVLLKTKGQPLIFRYNLVEMGIFLGGPIVTGVTIRLLWLYSQ